MEDGVNVLLLAMIKMVQVELQENGNNILLCMAILIIIQII